MTRRLALLAAALVPAGCGPRAALPTDDPSAARAAADPWPKAVAELRGDTDLATCRRVVAQLSADLAVSDAADRPGGLAADAEAALRAVVPLSDDDLAEVRPAAFTPLDPAYLADAYYLADAARMADRPGAAPADRARAAFGWVCRQVERRPLVVAADPSGRRLFAPALPPTAVLRRGSGSGLERAYVFLAVLHQMGLDGCLVGGPAAADAPAAAEFPPADPLQVPSGPFWAVGVRAGADVLLFDPWKGEPVAGPGGSGVATLAQAKADPGRVPGVPADQVTAAVPYLAAPLSALAPRLAVLEDKLRADAPVKLTVDPAGLAGRFAAAGWPAAFWNPPGDRFTYTRGPAEFLPADDGGRDGGPAGRRLFDEYMRRQLPAALFALPPGLSDGVRERLAAALANGYAADYLSPPTPRERLQRGRYADVIPYLVQRQAEYEAARERLRTDRGREAVVRKWLADANAAHDRLLRAKLDADPAAVADAEAAADRYWRDAGSGLGPLLDSLRADPGLAEATYLLALLKHEQAERRDGRAGGAARQRADDAWAEARDWWGRYAPLAAAQDRAFPGRAAHANRLADRAAAAAGL